MRPIPAFLRAVVVLGLAVVTGSCGGGLGPAAVPSAADQDSAGQPAAAGRRIVPPSSLLRSVTTIDAERCRWGSEFEAALPLNLVEKQDAAALFMPCGQWTTPGTPAAMAYATYGFDLGDYEDEAALCFEWSTPPAHWHDFHVGLSRFDEDTWEWHGGPPDGSLSLDSLEPYLSPGGTMLLLVALTGADECILNWVRAGVNAAPAVQLSAEPLVGLWTLTADFDASASCDKDGQIAAYFWDWEGDGEYDYNSGGQAVVQHTYENVGRYHPVVQVFDDESAADTATIDVFVTLPPVIELTATPTQGVARLRVSFDASASHDLDGEVAGFEWDWDGDGVYDTNSGLTSQIEYVYPQAGVFDATVRVTDDVGGAATASVQISVAGEWPSGEWHISVITDETWCQAPLISMDGIPAICYRTEADDWEGLLHFRRATSADGSSWLDPVTVADKVHETICALAIVHGHPAVAYWHAPSLAWYVMYARALDPLGEAWETPFMAAYHGDGGPLSLAVVGGMPSVAFTMTRDDPRFYFSQATDSFGASWSEKVRIMVASTVKALALGELGGRPAVFCQTSSLRDEVLFLSAADPAGADWNYSALIGYGTPDIEYSTSFALVHGTPATCFGGAHSFLNYVRAEDADGMDWSEPQRLDGRARTGVRCKLAVVGGYPFIAYVDSNEYLHFVRGLDPVGTSWTAPEVIDDSVTVRDTIHLVDINGYPAITYPTSDPNGINFAIYY